MKKFSFFCLVLFFFSIFFHKTLLGIGVRALFQMKYECELAYRSLDWNKGELIFSDLILFDPAFHARIERVSLRFDWTVFPKTLKGHLSIENPRVSILKKREIPRFSSSWFDISASVQGGILDWDEAVPFSAEHNRSETRLVFDWEDANALLHFQKNKIDAQFNNFKAPLLKPWVSRGEILNGRMTGKIEFDEKTDLVSANVQIQGFDFRLEEGVVQNLEGELSFHAGLGAKWEFKGIGQSQNSQFPLRWEGRGFFKRGWIDSKIEFGDGAVSAISGEEGWNLECLRLGAEQASWLQSGLILIWPDLKEWQFIQGVMTAKASFDSFAWKAEFEGENVCLKKEGHRFDSTYLKGNFTKEGGEILVVSPDSNLRFSGKWNDWSGEARFGKAYIGLKGGFEDKKFLIQIEKGALGPLEFRGTGWVDSHLDCFFSLDGEIECFEKKIPLHCSKLSKQGNLWDFDFRSPRKTWDLFRISGTYDGRTVLYRDRNHLLGSPLLIEPAPLGEWSCGVELPWKAVLSAAPFLNQWGIDLRQIFPIENTSIRFESKGGRTWLGAKGASPFFEARIEQKGDEWEIGLNSDLLIEGVVKKDGTVKGKGGWKKEVSLEFEGKIGPSFHCELSLPRISADLSISSPLQIRGNIEGQGHFIYDGQIESDLDFSISSLEIQSYPLENEKIVHLSYSSEKGALFQGIDLHGQFDCIVDLLEYDAHSCRWIFHRTQAHIPSAFLNHPLFEFLDKKKNFNFTADLEFPADFSTFSCRMNEGLIPYEGTYFRIEDLHLLWSRDKGSASFRTEEQSYRIFFHAGDQIEGRLILGEEEMPLVIEWEYGKELLIQSIEGSFAGIEASFHAEMPNVLVGSAQLNLTQFSKFLPPKVARVFQEIKMGKGYELKGRLKFEENRPLFSGILTGKGIELFGFQFRTLLARIDLSLDRVRISDLKISDSAGIMKIDELLLESKERAPWTIAIPNLSILEMRPSLLQRPGKEAGPISPLVVRELKMTDFKGILDDGKTYTADGRLHFINSYKREETLFDLPANVLSRIVGLDLELLIPVTGNLSFNLQDGYFNLLELADAYSEGKRSQFFLETNPPPRMDLDGRLQIFIKMKQFVLLKITESLLISIDGVLDDPQYHLKKKRFFGLM